MSTHRTENAAILGALLASRHPTSNAADLVLRLQKAARIAHRNAERACNGELPECPACHGDGWDCPKCEQTGYPAFARDSRRIAKLNDALTPYRLRLYEQTDPRGWPLYLIPEESGPASEDRTHYNTRGTAVCPH